ncbi:MAG: hypothetical protein RLZZ28_1606, partial [Bacteroidota bacterium]
MINNPLDYHQNPKKKLSGHVFTCIDAHTCGNPVRVVAAGGPALEGKNMSEKRQDFLKK